MSLMGTQETVAPNDICLAYDNFLILYLPQLNFRQSAETVEEPGLDARQSPLWSLHYLHDVLF